MNKKQITRFLQKHEDAALKKVSDDFREVYLSEKQRVYDEVGITGLCADIQQHFEAACRLWSD